MLINPPHTQMIAKHRIVTEDGTGDVAEQRSGLLADDFLEGTHAKPLDSPLLDIPCDRPVGVDLAYGIADGDELPPRLGLKPYGPD